MLTIETLEQGVLIVNFEHTSKFLVFLLLTLSKYKPAGEGSVQIFLKNITML